MQHFLSILGYIVGVAGAVTIIFSRVKTENLSDLKERVEILEKEREDARNQHIEHKKAIANLEGQLATYREIPLKSIANSLEVLSESNTNILTVLQKSALIAATDRDTLLNPNQNVENQNVVKQTIEKVVHGKK